jgi:phytoene dehydrogenase-like protein
MTNSHVERIIMEGGRAVGVTLRGGGVIRASKAVVSNASVWDTVTKLLPKEHVPEQVSTRSMGYLVLCNLTYFTSH